MYLILILVYQLLELIIEIIKYEYV